ncbi:MAG: radical SAM protein [Oscillospiraceae bacterium]|nr:radical SAM protein [Oscillospiraceae bacterium]
MSVPSRRLIPVFVPHLGCPNACVFCNQRRISGAQEAPTGEGAARIVREALEKTGPGAEAAFYGGSFTAIDEDLQEELLRAMDPFLRTGALERLRVSTRPDCVNEKSLERLRVHGVRTVELGAQSMDDEVLRLSGRGHRAADVVNASRLVKKMGFSLILQMMTGLPGDTREKAAKTARSLADLAPDGVRIYPTVVVEDTPLADMWREGKYFPHTPEEAAVWCADLIAIFESQSIPIIRLGLNPTEELSGGKALAGAYHPAMGELARGELMLRKIEALLDGRRGGKLTIRAPRGMTSIIIGQNRRNVRVLMEKYGFASVKVYEDGEASEVGIL